MVGGEQNMKLLQATNAFMQADYTRKTQALKEQTGLSAEEITELRAIRDAQQTPQPAAAQQEPQAPAFDNNAFEAWLYEGTLDEKGRPLTMMDVAEIADPVQSMHAMDRLISQRTQAAARREAYQAMQTVTPHIQQLQQQYGAREVAEAQSQAEAFFTANPDLLEHRDVLGRLIAAGETVENAAEMVRTFVNKDRIVAEATTAGLQAGHAAAKQVQQHQQQFSTPSGTTPAGGGPTYTKDMDLSEIARKAVG